MTFVTSPANGSKVGRRTTVVGFVVSDETLPIQVYLQSSDGTWYLQEPTEELRAANLTRYWSCDCVFGDENTQPGEKFTVFVVESLDRPPIPVSGSKQRGIEDKVVYELV